MSSDWFNEWVGLFCQATGGDARVRTILLACRHEIVTENGATLGELGECTSRLVSSGRVPEYPTEVTNALVRELKQLRLERAGLDRPGIPSEPDEYPRCDLCGGGGFVAVPVPKCIWQGRIVCYPGTARVVTGAVLCDRPGCERGRQARERESRLEKRRATYSDYIRRFGGLDVAALLREFEREEAAAARRRAPFRALGEDEFRKLKDNIAAKVADGEANRGAA